MAMQHTYPVFLFDTHQRDTYLRKSTTRTATTTTKKISKSDIYRVMRFKFV